MKIKKLTVTNFKSLKNVTIDNFLDVNMIYGYNNSGKSNLFKFLELLFASNETREPVRVESETEYVETRVLRENFWEKVILNQPFIFRQEGSKRLDINFDVTVEVAAADLQISFQKFASLKEIFFADSDGPVLLRVVGEISSVSPYQAQQKLNEAFINRKRVYRVDNGTPEVFEGAEDLNFRDFRSLFGLLNNCIMLLDNDRYFINEREHTSDEEINSKNFKNKIFDLSLAFISESDFNKLNSFLGQYVTSSRDNVYLNNEKSNPFRQFKFEFVRLGSEIEIFLKNEFGKFPLSNYGTGVQQIIFILSKIFLAEKRVVLIEEVELNLSPKYQLELIDFLAKCLGTRFDQLLYTTHSPLMCYKTQFRALQARIDASGISTIVAIAPKAEDVHAFKAAMKILEHYHPPVSDTLPSRSARKGKSLERAVPEEAAVVKPANKESASGSGNKPPRKRKIVKKKKS